MLAYYQPKEDSHAFQYNKKSDEDPIKINITVQQSHICKVFDDRTGPLACLSLSSIMSWIRSGTSIWKLLLSQSCSPK